LKTICKLAGREITLVQDGRLSPAVYLIHDKECGGILVNTPKFDPELAAKLRDKGVAYIFLTSHLAVFDLDDWRKYLNAKAIASAAEQTSISGHVDVIIDNKTRLSRTIDFLPMSGRTRGNCALRLRNIPATIFFGAALDMDDAGLPTLSEHSDDYSWENRVIGAIALTDLKYEYAFTDSYIGGQTIGPQISEAIARNLKRVTG